MRPAAAALALVAAACARMEPPPGGPPDNAGPLLVATVPESTGVVPGFSGDVEFRFNETVSEGSSPNLGAGTGDLERLVVLSPDSQVPVVSWKRSRISVRPREGWQPGRTYRVELLPGVTDLRRNRMEGGAVVTFSTGGPPATDTVRGRVGDWTTGRPAPLAVVEAILLPDSLAYRTLTDSTGRFVLGPLPTGEYLLRATIDGNRNLRHDPREAWDTTRAAVDSAALWTFPHDTVGPRLQAVRVRDSVSLGLTFSQALLPGQQLDAGMIRVLQLPDSTPVEVIGLRTPAAHDSLYRPAIDSTAADSAAVDSAVARPDTARAAPPPRPGALLPGRAREPRTRDAIRDAGSYGSRVCSTAHSTIPVTCRGRLRSPAPANKPLHPGTCKV